MPRWICSKCYRKQESYVKSVSASGKQVWTLYQLLHGVNAAPSDKLCPSCHLKIQKHAGKLNRKIDEDFPKNNPGPFIELTEAEDLDQTQNGSVCSSTSIEQVDSNTLGNCTKLADGSWHLPQSEELINTPAQNNGLSQEEASNPEEGKDQLGLRGLRNIGNTCYMGSILQCLSNTKPVIDFVLSNGPFQLNNNSTTKGELFLAFARLLQDIWDPVATDEVNITLFKLQMEKLCPEFCGSRQHDSQELLMMLLDGLHNDLTVHNQNFSILTAVQDNLPDEEKSRLVWELDCKRNSSLIQHAFAGQLKSSVSCLICGHISTKYETFWTISLPLPNPDAFGASVSLDQCLSMFTRRELLKGDERPTCQKCQKRQTCSKRLSFERLPEILIIHLKRFSQVTLRKLDTEVKYPLENLLLGNSTDSSCNNSSYSLFGVSSHFGTTIKGHYVAFAKHPHSNQWHRYDDSHVTLCDPEALGGNAAYVLFYKRSVPANDETTACEGVGETNRMETADDVILEGDLEDFGSSSHICPQPGEESQVYEVSSQESSGSTDLESSFSDCRRASSKSSGSELSQSGSHVVFRNILSCKTTQAKCFICGEKSNGRVRVPKCERDRVWNEIRMRIPKNNRCCRSHMKQGRLQEQDLNIISTSSERTRMSIIEVEEWILGLSAQIAFKGMRVDFESNDLVEEDYTLLTGVKMENFNDLLKYLGNDVKGSKNRSRRNALGMFLLKMRLNLSHTVLQFLFGVSNISTVSDTIHAVANALTKNFVPKYLGINHMSRDELKTQKSISTFNRLVNASEDQLLLILDGTYLFIQKPSDFLFQRKTFSAQKARNLLKPMMIITTTGYILDAEGLFGADGKNNDANILKYIMKMPESVGSLLQENDVMILDRGFRDVIQTLEENGISTKMPQLLKKKQKQFTTLEANESRTVTMIRWMVESVNGRIKNMFKFFAGTINNSHIPSLKSYLDIACSIINAYSPPLLTDSLDLNNLVDKALERKIRVNELQQYVEEHGLERKRSQWVEADSNSFLTFPKLTLEDIKGITLGTYQIKMAELYTQQHMSPRSGYRILLHTEDRTLIRAKIHSRFKNSTTHNLWIRFEENGEGANSIHHYCKCKAGTRTLGICAHITSVIWYLGYARHHPGALHQKRKLANGILDAALEFDANPDNEDEDGNGNNDEEMNDEENMIGDEEQDELEEL